MELAVKEIIFKSIPTSDEIEMILESNKNTKINIANTKRAYYVDEIEHLKYYGSNINGLNIIIDEGDQCEVEHLCFFANLEYLRITVQNNSLQIPGCDYFLDWLLNAENLNAIALETYPFNDEISLNLLSSHFSYCKNFPVSLFIKKKRGKAKKKAYLNLALLTSFKKLQIFEVSNLELSRIGVMREFKENNIIKGIDRSDFQFSGCIDVEEGEWKLNVKSLSFSIYKEAVISFEGYDDMGKFTCESRCEWNEAEGGFYFSYKVPIIYSNFPNSEEECSIKITDLLISKNGECKIFAEWMQNGESWQIDGILYKEKIKKQIESIRKRIGLPTN